MAASIDRDEVLRYLGYAGQPIDEALLSRIEGVIAECEATIQPRTLSREYAICLCADGVSESFVRVEGTMLELAGCDIRKHLAGATSCILLAGTLGAKSEREIARRSAHDPLEGCLFDAACSALIEAAMDDEEGRVRRDARKRGRFSNGRFSPGYGDLSLEVQPMFLEALNATRRLGIAMTPSGMMTPSKSVTAVLGLFETPQAAAAEGTEESCASCPARDGCAFRAKGRRCYGD